MPRRGFIPKREVLPDPVYGTVVVTKLINQIMYDGKRGCAQAVCYEASMISPASLSDILRSPRLRANITSQRRASVCRRSGRISIGT